MVLIFYFRDNKGVDGVKNYFLIVSLMMLFKDGACDLG